MGLLSTIHRHSHNTTVVQRGPERIDVHEHRAPTDESVKLLNEMQKKAKQDIIAELKFDDNVLNGVCIVYQDHYMTTASYPRYELWLKFSINGKEYEINERFNTEFPKDATAQQIIQHAETEALGKIANYIFAHLKVEILAHIGCIKSKRQQEQIIKTIK